MKSKRKLIDIEELVNRANNRLTMTGFTQHQKMGICMAIEDALFLTNTYGGYRYLDSVEGVNFHSDDWKQNHEFNRRYYVSWHKR